MLCGISLPLCGCLSQDLQYDPEDKDDFTTPLDDKGRAILAAIQENKKQR